MDQPQQRHFGGLARVRGDVDILKSLEQHLPEPVDRRPTRAAAPFLPRFRAPRRSAAHRRSRPPWRASRDAGFPSARAAAASDRSRAHALRRARQARPRHRLKAPAASSRRIRPRSARPSMSRTCSAVTAPAPWAIAWSRIDRPSRAEPSAARAIIPSASGSTSTPSAFETSAKCAASFSAGNAPQVEALAARQHRHRHLVHFGRREKELHMLRRLLKSFEQRIECILGKHVNFVDDVDLVAGADRGVADRVDDLANVVDAGVRRRRPSRSRRYAGLRQSRGMARRRCTGVIVGPPCPSGPMQLSALAISRAVDVLPTPRTPVSRKACAIRPRSIALASVFTIASWPISSAKVCGRYLRASTR